MNLNQIEDWEQFEDCLKNNKLHLLWGSRTVQIEITNKCNYKCVMCDRWKWNYHKISNKELTLNEIKELFQDLAKNTKCKEIILSGGEPFLRGDIKEIIIEAKKNNLAVSVFTNGSCLNEELNDFLIKENVNLSFSLDGYSYETHNKIRGVDSFNKVIKNLDYFAKNFRKNIIGVNFVIQKDNFNEIKGLYNLLLDKNVDYIRFGIVHGRGNQSLNHEQLEIVKKQIKIILSQKDKKVDLFVSDYILNNVDIKESLPAEKLFNDVPLNCYKVNNYSIIDAFGNVFPCTYAHFDNQDYENFNEKRMKSALGNIRVDSFSIIWNNNTYLNFRNKVMPVNISTQRDICGQCEHYYEFKQLEDSRKIFCEIKGLCKNLGKPSLYLYEFDEK